MSEVLKENETKRIDSEYFKKDFLSFIEELKNKNYEYFENIASIKGGKRLPLGCDFSAEGTPYIRAEDVKNGFVQYETSPKISKFVYNQIKQYQTKFDDVLLTIVGNSIGDIGIVKFHLDICNLTENCVRIFSKKINPNFLFIFLCSKIGQLEIEREKVGTAQPKLSIERIRKFLIPILPDKFQKEIECIVKNAHSLLEQSKKDYKDAENLLLETLDIQGDRLASLQCKLVEQPQVATHAELVSESRINCNIKKLSQSFMQTGRLDAEYYQSKYVIIEEKIKQNGGVDFFEVCVLNDKNFNPLKNEKYKYIELANIGENGEITGCLECFGNELPTRARRLVHSGDILISSIEGSLQSCAIVTNEYNNALCSTGFYVITPTTKMNVESLLLIYKSKPIQELLKKACSGTILTAMSKDEFTSIKIPLLPHSTQEKIASLVQSSFAKKAQSKALLQKAKSMVEQEIEK